MARKLKVFRTHIGFYDLIVAAPSQKAALEAWHAGPQQFSQGFASVTDDPKLKEAALEKPGVVLKRQFGSKGAFTEDEQKLRAPKISKKTSTAKARKEEKAKAAARRKEKSEELAAIDRQEKEALADIGQRIRNLDADKKDVKSKFAARRKAIKRERR
jgi:hypothetical protein